MFRLRDTTVLFFFVLMSAILASCWDKTEMNELALVSMVGVDTDPESGRKTVYYQIINPLSGTSAIGAPGGEQAPAYTYEISGRSFGEIRSKIYKILPRKLFIAHYKALIVSERAARNGIRDIVNFVEMQPKGRASVPMLIADDPLSKIMKTFTPLERLPSNAVDSRLKLLVRDSLIAGKKTKIKDVIERMEKSDPIVLPMITSRAETIPPNSGETSSNIDANRNNFIIGGGAVFQDYRMVGKLNDAQLIWYHLLEGDRGRHIHLFQLNGKRTSMGLKLVRMERTVRWQQDRPIVGIRLDLQLSSALSIEYVPKTKKEIQQLEKQVNRIITKELNAFYEKTKAQGWDLLGIKDLLERNRRFGHQNTDTAAKNAKVVFMVHSKLSQVGMNTPY